MVIYRYIDMAYTDLMSGTYNQKLDYIFHEDLYIPGRVTDKW